MKYERTPRFDSDFKNLSVEHRKQFLAIIPAFNKACGDYLASPGGFSWPKSLRVSRMSSAKGVWELTWSFSSPDGRATFELVNVEEETRVRWRRIGSHRIYRDP